MKISGLFLVPPPDLGNTAGRTAALGGVAARVPAGLGVPGAAEITGRAGLPAEAVTAKVQTDAAQSLLSALKLPNDSLSESLVSFFRYFSLPLEPKTLGSARREALSQPKREAAALALAAAADKGLTLEGRALVELADAVDSAGPRSGEDGGGEEADPGADNLGGRDGGQRQGGNGGARDNGTRGETEARAKANHEPPAEEIRETVTGILKKRPVLDFVNRVPGKNGRWMVFPFSFSSGDTALNVSFRVFVNGDTAERLAADVTVWRKNGQSSAASGAETRWWFLLDKTRQQMEFTRKPPAAESGKLVSRIAGFFGIAPDRAVLRDDAPLFADAKDRLRSVDEKV